MKEQKTIYAVVIIPKYIEKNDTSPLGCNVYSKQTSNKAVMIDYYNEIKRKHGKWARVYLVSRERAKEIEKQYYAWCRERERKLLATLEGCSDKMATLMAREAYILTTEKK